MGMAIPLSVGRGAAHHQAAQWLVTFIVEREPRLPDMER
ncbi:hypothetical protein BEI_1449 [Halomonas beimenensis]|uniref:Uncharacterized protein n=1 Tax=Halomonas beimenensis TaxID=475662 RepID=A0A291P6B6_9GAMM|nr:hypothetical protein BEI_1449 [Halomonas beimenensis]